MNSRPVEIRGDHGADTEESALVNQARDEGSPGAHVTSSEEIWIRLATRSVEHAGVLSRQKAASIVSPAQSDFEAP